MEKYRVKLTELPNGRGHAAIGLFVIMGLIGLAVICAGILRVGGSMGVPMTQAEWEVVHQERTYGAYVDAVDAANDASVLMALVTPIGLGILGWLFYRSLVQDVVKCPNGHVEPKKASYCSQCAQRLYTQNELSPDEWNKKYGEASHG